MPVFITNENNITVDCVYFLANRMNKLLEKNKKGSVLAFALVIMSAVMIILVSMIGYVVSQMKYSYYEASREQSLQIAEAGAYFYRWYLAHEVEGKTAEQIQEFWEGSPQPYGIGTPYEVEYKDPQGAGIGKFSISVDPPVEYSTIVIVRSTGWTYKNPEHQRTVQVRFRRPSWSEYAVLADVETSYIRFGDRTDVSGPLHSNGGIHFDGVAHNTVKSGVSTYYDSDSGINAWKDGVWTAWPGEYNTTMSNNVFIGGKDYPADIIDFSGMTSDLGIMKTKAGDTGDYYNDRGVGRRIIFKTNGTYDICTVNAYYASPNSNGINNYLRNSGSGTCSSCSTGNNCWSNRAIPNNGVIFVEDNVWLEGKINGKKVTIVAAGLDLAGDPNVFIGSDIEYTNYDGTDIIGIIAEKNVEIIKNSEGAFSGTDDQKELRIDAALVAQKGKVGRDYYSVYYGSGYSGGCGWQRINGTWQWGCGTNWYLCVSGSCKDNKNNITVYGAIATSQRYGFAYTDGTGYTNRNLLYDNNLLYYPPPYFPTGTEYSLDLWEEL